MPSSSSYRTIFSYMMTSMTMFTLSLDSWLREDNRAPTALHHPKNVDTASALALLQEEEIGNSKRKVCYSTDHRDVSRQHNKLSWSEKGKSLLRKEDSGSVDKSDRDDRLAALMAHRMKLGLCFKCGEKWFHGHKCQQHIPLHVLEEVLDALESVADSSDEEADAAGNSDCPVLAIDSKLGVSQQKRKTMKLLGHIGKEQI